MYRIADNKIDIVRVPPFPISSMAIEIRSSRIDSCSLNSDEKSGLAESGCFVFICYLNCNIGCLYTMCVNVHFYDIGRRLAI